jgi:hypothetical protein
VPKGVAVVLAIVPVPLPLSVKVKPVGNVRSVQPLSLALVNVGDGIPLVVTGNVPAVPAVKVVAASDVIDGGFSTETEMSKVTVATSVPSVTVTITASV